MNRQVKVDYDEELQEIDVSQEEKWLMATIDDHQFQEVIGEESRLVQKYGLPVTLLWRPYQEEIEEYCSNQPRMPVPLLFCAYNALPPHIRIAIQRFHDTTFPPQHYEVFFQQYGEFGVESGIEILIRREIIPPRTVMTVQ